MPYHSSFLPVPMLSINRDMQIIGSNEAAYKLLPHTNSILDIFETQSKHKAEIHLCSLTQVADLEVNVLTITGEVLLADLYIAWSEEDIGEVLIIKKDRTIEKVTDHLERLKVRLSKTNFELLEAKETAEELLEENIRLSSPFIEVSESIALIPIFGELDVRKSEMIASTLARRASRSDAEILIFDFTAVSRIAQDGLGGLEAMLNVMQLLGFSLVIAGLHPQHVKEWNRLEFKMDILFRKSLKQAMDHLLSEQHV